MISRSPSLQGTRFGRLQVESLSRITVQHKRKRSRACAIVICDCGARKTVLVDDLAAGRIQSCGCLRRDVLKERARPLSEKFWEKVNKNGPISEYRPDFDPCWLWTAAVNAKGYGIMCVKNGTTMAHRISYNIHLGQVPSGKQIDHLCRVRNCVNPKHLEAVLPIVNTHRGYTNATKTHCPHGHPYSGENLYISPRGNRQCRECVRRSQMRYQKRKLKSTK